MENKRSGTGLGVAIIVFLIFLGLMSTSEEFDPPQSQSSSSTWQLVEFENLAIEHNGQLFDKGWFVNTVTGEKLEARCVTMNHTDPTNGDAFELVGKQLKPKKDGSQTFELLFEVIQPTPTLEPTSTSILTHTPTSQPMAVEPATEPVSSPSFNPFKNLGSTLLTLLCIAIIAIPLSLIAHLVTRSRFGG